MSQNPEQTIAELQQKIKSLELQLKKAKDSSGYGLKWEEKPEIFEERAQNALPLLKEDKSLLIDNKSDLDHIIIEGDNYHALSALNYTHKGMIDVIYIDPPYNTGNKDFIYNDDYVDPEDTYRHSKWLSFMNKRLRLAKKLLSDDGVIFISIDDNEQANLKLLCDDIFGEENFISNLPRKTTEHIRVNATYELQNLNDFVFVYSKNKQKVVLNKKIVGEKNFDNIDEYGSFLLKPFQNSGENGTRSARPNLYYPIFFNEKTKELTLNRQENSIEILPKKVKKEDGRRLRSKEKFIKDNWLLEYRNGTIRRKEYFSENNDNNKYQSEKNRLDMFPNRLGASSLNELGLNGIFDYSKPPELIEFLLKLGVKRTSIILDFFAGSGTTGHAVLNLNKQDGGHRQFILCSNRENTKEEPEKNICKNITYERVKRVMQGYTSAKGEKVEGLKGGNLRYYTTDFIEKDKSIDDLRFAFMDRCDELLCIKENTFETVRIEENNYLKSYKKGDKITVILYDGYYFDDLIEFLKSCNEKEISLYIFDLSKEMYEEDIMELGKNISIQNIPNDILETYKKIFIL